MFKSVPDIFPTSSFEYDPSLRFRQDEIESFDEDHFDELSFDELTPEREHFDKPIFNESDFRREANEWISLGVNFVDTRLDSNLAHKGYSNSEIIRIIELIDPEVIGLSLLDDLIHELNRVETDPTLYVDIIDKLMSRVRYRGRSDRILKLEYAKFKDLVAIKEFIKSGSNRMSNEIYDLFYEFPLESMRFGLDPYRIRDPKGNLIIDSIIDEFELGISLGLIETYHLPITKNQASRLGKKFDKWLNVKDYYPGMIDDAMYDLEFLYGIVTNIEGITKKDIQFWDQMMLRWEERSRYIERIVEEDDESRYEPVSRL